MISCTSAPKGQSAADLPVVPDYWDGPVILKDGFHLTFSRCFWSTYIDGDQYDVDLHIRGETDADEITIDSYGDGVGYPKSIEIKKKGVFEGTVNICFRRERMPDPDIYTTYLTLYKEGKAQRILMKSNLIYFIEC